MDLSNAIDQRVELPGNGQTLFVRRFDMLHPEAGGNKLFKLRYWLQRRANGQAVVSFGGCFSNHLLALSALGREQHFPTIGVVRGEQQSNPWLRQMLANGMQLIFVSRTEYRNKEAIAALLQDRHNALIIPEGGAGPEGIRGASDMIAVHEPYDIIVLAGATGTTLGGLMQKNREARLLCIQILKGQHAICNQLVTYKLSERMPENVQVSEAYHFGGYARMPDKLLQFVNTWARDTGIPLDPVYTGKAMYGLLDLICKKEIPPDKRILFLHTGGNPGLFGQSGC